MSPILASRAVAELLLVDRHYGGCGVRCVLGRHIPLWAGTVLRRLAEEDIGRVGDVNVNGHFVSDSVCGIEGKGAGRVVLRTEVARQCFSLFKPHLEIDSRVMGERAGKGKVHGG